MSKEVPIKAPETGKAKAAPASGAGAGARLGSWAETTTAARKTARTKALMMLTKAIDEIERRILMNSKRMMRIEMEEERFVQNWWWKLSVEKEYL